MKKSKSKPESAESMDGVFASQVSAPVQELPASAIAVSVTLRQLSPQRSPPPLRSPVLTLCFLSVSAVKNCRVRRSARSLRFFLPRRRRRPRGTGRGLRAIRHAGDGHRRPQWRLRRAAIPHGDKKSRPPRSHRVRNHLHRRPFVPAARRNPRGISESLPADHPHEAARQKRRRRGYPRRDRRVLARTPLHHPPSQPAPARYFRASISTPNSSATTSAKKRRTIKLPSTARATSASR